MFNQLVGRLELPCQLGSFCAEMVHGVAFLSNNQFFRPLVRVLMVKLFRSPQKVQNVMTLSLNAGAQITIDGQLQVRAKTLTFAICK